MRKKKTVTWKDNLSTSLILKLASIIVHSQEFLSSDGHDFDRESMRGLINDAEVVEWINNIPEVLLPLKRNGATK